MFRLAGKLPHSSASFLAYEIYYASITRFQQHVELKDFRAPTKKEYVRYVHKLPSATRSIPGSRATAGRCGANRRSYFFKWPETSLVISNMLTCFLPLKTALRLSSALMKVRFERKAFRIGSPCVEKPKANRSF